MPWMSFEPREFLRHILAETEYLTSVGADLTRHQLETDPTIQRAVVRSIEIIGEASKRVPATMWPVAGTAGVQAGGGVRTGVKGEW